MIMSSKRIWIALITFLLCSGCGDGKLGHTPEEKTLSQLLAATNGLQCYEQMTGRLPTASEGLATLAEDVLGRPRIAHPRLLIDRWGSALQYVPILVDGHVMSYRVYSFGPNLKDDNELGDDISTEGAVYRDWLNSFKANDPVDCWEPSTTGG